MLHQNEQIICLQRPLMASGVALQANSWILRADAFLHSTTRKALLRYVKHSTGGGGRVPIPHCVRKKAMHFELFFLCRRSIVSVSSEFFICPPTFGYFVHCWLIRAYCHVKNVWRSALNKDLSFTVVFHIS